MRVFLAGFLLLAFPFLSYGQSAWKEDLETQYGFELAKKANVTIDYTAPSQLRVYLNQSSSITHRDFDDEEAGFQYIETISKKRDLVVVHLSKVLRMDRKHLRVVADNLQVKLESLGFSTLVFEEDDAEDCLIYRIFKSN